MKRRRHVSQSCAGSRKAKWLRRKRKLFTTDSRVCRTRISLCAACLCTKTLSNAKAGLRPAFRCRLHLLRKGHEAAVGGRRAVEADQHTLVVDAVDHGRADAVGIIDGLEPACARPHKAVGIAALVHVVTNHLTVID